MDQRRRSTIFGFKSILTVALFIIIDTNLIHGAPQNHEEHNEKCDDLKFRQCAQSYINTTGILFVSSKEDLNNVCLKFDENLSCINKYKDHCTKQSNRFDELVSKTATVVNELCKQGPYQEEFLQHAPCMSRTTNVYEICKKNDLQTIVKDMGTTTDLKTRVCCAFQEYVKCTMDAMRQACGEKTAKFSESFRHRLSNLGDESECNGYDDKCGLAGDAVTTSTLQAI